MDNFAEQFDEMSEPATSGQANSDGARVILRAEAHYNHVRGQLESVVSMKDKGIQLGDDGPKIEAGTDMHKGFLAGIQVALHIMGEFPLKIAERDSDDEE